MNKTQQLTDNGFTEATDADALFDDEATVLAQPVVPLAANPAGAPEELTVVAGAPASGVFSAARRPTLLALVLVSALAGAVIGGTALYIFLRGRTAPAPNAAPAPQQSAGAATTTTTAPVENVPVENAPVENPQPAARNSEQPAAPNPEQPAPQDSQPAPPASEPRAVAVHDQRPEAEPRREHEGDDDRADAQWRDRRRGRGGDDDYENDDRDAALEQAAERRRRRDGALDTQAPIPDDASPASRRAARVEEALRRIENNRPPRRPRRVGILN